MAVQLLGYTINQGGNIIFPLSQCVDFLFQFTPVAAHETQRMIWQLAHNGQNITEEEFVRDRGSNIRLNFTDIIQQRLMTTMPALDLPFPALNSNAAHTIRLTYKTAITNTDSCDTIQTAEETLDFTVVNSRYLPYEDYDFQQLQVLSRRPLRYNRCISQHDFIHVYFPIGEYDISLLLLDSTPTAGDAETIEYSISSKGGVYCIPLQYSNTPKDGQVGILFIFENNTIIHQYVFNFEGCCCDGDWAELYFLESSGSYASFAFECLEEVNITRENTMVCLPLNCVTITDTLSVGGRQLVNPKSYRKYKLKQRLDYSKEMIEWIISMATSRFHYIKYKRPDGTFDRAKFLVDNSDYKVYQEEEFIDLEIQGRLIIEDPVL